MTLEDLETAIRNVNKKFGKNVFTTAEAFRDDRLPTGSVSLDRAMEGGWPFGRMCLIWGNKSAGKSTLSLWAAANAQKQGKKVLFIDAEKSLRSNHIETHGVKSEDLHVLRMNNVEDILQATEDIIKRELVDVIILDSINSVNTVRYLDDNSGAIGLHARSMSELLAKWNAWNNNTLILMISQVRMKIQNLMAHQSYSGGMAMDFYTSIILKLFTGKDDYVSEDIVNGNKVREQRVGQKVNWEITKSKVSRPGEKGIFTMLYSGGADALDELVDLSVFTGTVDQRAAWFYFPPELQPVDQEVLKFQGKSALKTYLAENPDTAEALRKLIL